SPPPRRCRPCRCRCVACACLDPRTDTVPSSHGPRGDSVSRISIPIQIRWSDIDGYGHVNNAAMLTLLEEARIATFWNADLPEGAARPTQTLVGGPTAEHFTLVARQEVEYLAPLPFSQRPARVDLWVSRIGGASLEVNYEVFSPDRKSVGEGRGGSRAGARRMA